MPFREIVGHRKLIALLRRSIERRSLPPSLILSGPQGVGKRMAAMAVAQAVNCLEVKPGVESAPAVAADWDACGVCPACKRIARGVHPDVLVLEPNDKGNIKIDQVREAIDRSGYRPFEGRCRVTIVDQADGLERSAQNALLKVLEEPPSSSLFLLVTAWPDLLLPTVRSRCPQLRFRPLDAADVAAILVRQGTPEKDAVAVAALADGSVTRALEITESDIAGARDIALRVLEHVANSDDVKRRMESAKELVAKGAGPASAERDQLAVTLRAMSSLLRDISAIALSADRAVLAHPDLTRPLERLKTFAGDRGQRAFLTIDQGLAALERYTNAKLVADWVVLQL